MNQAHEGDHQAGDHPPSGDDSIQPQRQSRLESQQHSTVTSNPVAEVTHEHGMITPSARIVEEAKTLEAERSADSSHRASAPMQAPPVPDVFLPKPEIVQPLSAATPGADSNLVGETAPSPSGRWQAFWFAVSALALGLAVLTTSLITRQGTLRKMLVGFTPQGTSELFGTPFDIGLAKTGLALMLVVVPLFVLATFIVDRYRANNPTMNSVPMKQVAYVLMVVTVLFIIGSLSAELYLFISNNLGRENAVSIAAPIAELVFAGAYMYWLYTTVSEDRSS